MSYGYGMMGMGMGMMGMRMGMGMMGMGMMGMMGMGMMGGGHKTTPPAEKPPDLKREEQIQLGTNFVTRIEVRRQPKAQIRAYLERQMGLSDSETNEVLRRSGIDPAAGQEERISGRDAYLVSHDSEARRSSPALSPDGNDAEQHSMGDQSLQAGQTTASLAYAAAAAVLAPSKKSWKSWLCGHSAEEAALKAYQSYQQQLLQQAYSSAGQYVPSTLVLQAGEAGASAVGPGRSMGYRIMLVLVVGCWLLARAGLARWLLYQLAASCGLVLTAPNGPNSKKNQKKTKKVATQATGGSDSIEEIVSLQKTIAVLREQVCTNHALLMDIDEPGLTRPGPQPQSQPQPQPHPERELAPTASSSIPAGEATIGTNLDKPDTSSGSTFSDHEDKAPPKAKKKAKKKAQKKVKTRPDGQDRPGPVSAQKTGKQSRAKPDDSAGTIRSIRQREKEHVKGDQFPNPKRVKARGRPPFDASSMPKTNEIKKKLNKTTTKKKKQGDEMTTTRRTTTETPSWKPSLPSTRSRTTPSPLAQHLPDPNITPIAEDADR